MEQIKSKSRVKNQGEVFTNQREVNAMCDLVSQECERIDSRFLEPACGTGNFLAEILQRKLNTVKKLYKKNAYDYERFSVLAISSIYGVDLMQDNAEECRARLFEIWNKEYESICKSFCNNETREAVIYILKRNILCGDALTLMQVNEKQENINKPIIFPEWSIISGTKIKRRDFRLDVLLKAKAKPEDGKLFDDDELNEFLSINPVTGEYMPEPISIYPAVSYKQIKEVNDYE